MSEIKTLCCPFCGETLRRNCLGNGEHDKNDCVLSGFEIPIKWFPLWNVRKPMQEIMERLEAHRDDFLDDVYAELDSDPDNCRANRIIEQYDEVFQIVKEVGGMNG